MNNNTNLNTVILNTIIIINNLHIIILYIYYIHNLPRKGMKARFCNEICVAYKLDTILCMREKSMKNARPVFS